MELLINFVSFQEMIVLAHSDRSLTMTPLAFEPPEF